MSTYRVERVNQIIKDELSSFINYEMNDPRIKEAVITVTDAKATPDMKYVKVFVSIYGCDEEKKKELLGVLDKAKGFMRKHLSGVLTTRFTPQIVFELDTSLDYAMHIEKVLSTLDIKPAEEDDDDFWDEFDED
ncbi:MAG: 30S ribosome-binding factor RbfA [Anaerofustis stercorihominis]|nr:30S ribosome-binding factor RbfA [Anaerofustis stercorihominis]